MNAKDFVSMLFDHWEKGDAAPFFDALASDVIWTAKGTTPISGRYGPCQCAVPRLWKNLKQRRSFRSQLDARAYNPARERVVRISGDFGIYRSGLGWIVLPGWAEGCGLLELLCRPL